MCVNPDLSAGYTATVSDPTSALPGGDKLASLSQRDPEQGGKPRLDLESAFSGAHTDSDDVRLRTPPPTHPRPPRLLLLFTYFLVEPFTTCLCP